MTESTRFRLPSQLLVLALTLLACRADLKDNGGIDPNLSVAQVFLNPGNVTISAGDVFRFDTYGLNTLGDSIQVPLDWTADGGTLTTGGFFSAASVGTYQVIARARFAPHPADTALVTVTAPAVVLTDIVINPISPILAPGEVRPFVAEAHFSDSSIAAASVTWTATGGTVDQVGNFTAGPNLGSFQVIATSTTQTVADTVGVTITSQAPTVQSVVLSPDTVTLRPGTRQQFIAFANYTDGTFAPAAAVYTTTAGQITSSGLYTATQVPGSYRVIARHLASGKADTADVVVAASSMVRVILSPPTSSLTTGSAQQFTVLGKFSDSSTAPVAVTFVATGGTITAGGLYTAGQTVGAYNVFATTTNGLFADTSTVQINQPNVVLTSVRIRPRTVSILAGSGQQFSATGTYSDGSQATIIPTYQVTGGTITAAGAYTAPAQPGSYRVIAKVGSVADTADVTVTSQATLTRLTVSPSSSALLTGGLQQFTAVGNLSNGGTTTVNVNWTATCGSVTTSGQYTAPGAPATCLVIATQQGGTLSDSATVTASNLPPTSAACSNEPSGMTPVFDHPWDAIPPIQPTKDQYGWNVRNQNEANKLSIVQDATAPLTPSNIVAGSFPQGHNGGTAPFGLTRTFRQTDMIYMCVFTMLDPAFTNGGNNNVKFGFFLTPYTGGTFGLNHYFNMTNNVGVQLQSGATQLNRTMLSSFSLIGHRGQWVKIEWLIIGNTLGNVDGVAKVWANGSQVLSVSNVEYFFSNQPPLFNGITWNPTYGGGLNPVPYTQYQFIDNWYLSIR